MTLPREVQNEDRRQSVRDTARTFAPDHYVTALLAPSDVREDLITLAAFWGETGRIAQTVGEVMLGEIRLQWWRDALQPGASPSGHPVGDAMLDLMTRRGLDNGRLQKLLDARGEELHRLPFFDEAAFATYLDDADGGLLRLSAGIRGIHDDAAQEMIVAAANAIGRVRVALDLPYFAANGRLPLWSDALGDASETNEMIGARQAIEKLVSGARHARAEVLRLAVAAPRRLIDAVLPVALLEPYLHALEAKGHDPLRDVVSISPLGRMVRLTWARVSGRL